MTNKSMADLLDRKVFGIFAFNKSVMGTKESITIYDIEYPENQITLTSLELVSLCSEIFRTLGLRFPEDFLKEVKK